jgi:glycosyltransferase involved in cell wall biosynthesis
MSQLMVSICCAAYNHEEYIAAALDGFLMQKADFSYEILVHDDASTDNTAKIIKEYEQNYPDIIKPIYQTENQYSKKVKISSAYNFPRAKGKYIAWCEGDDYWTDPLKLQTQVDYMEAHP